MSFGSPQPKMLCLFVKEFFRVFGVQCLFKKGKNGSHGRKVGLGLQNLGHGLGKSRTLTGDFCAEW